MSSIMSELLNNLDEYQGIVGELAGISICGDF
jgi:hypothetical protein